MKQTLIKGKHFLKSWIFLPSTVILGREMFFKDGLGFESRTDDVVSKVEVRRQVTGGGEKLTQELGAVAEHQLVGLEHRPEKKTSQLTRNFKNGPNGLKPLLQFN